MRGILTLKEYEKFGIGTPLNDSDKLNEDDLAELKSLSNNVIQRNRKGKLSVI